VAETRKLSAFWKWTLNFCMHWSKVISSSAFGCKTFSIRWANSCLVNILTLINNYKSRHLFFQEETVTRLQLSVVALKFFLDLETVLLVKLESCIVACLHMQTHFLNLACSDAVLDDSLEHLGTYTIPLVRGQHRDCHYVADVFIGVLINVLFAADSAD